MTDDPSDQARDLVPVELGVGLDMSSMATITEEEKQRFIRRFEEINGRRHIGQEFLLEHRPEVLKRYRNWADRFNIDSAYRPTGFGFVALYAMTGFVEGVRYIVELELRRGLSKAEVMDGIAIAFLWVGPRGIETIGIALDDFDWERDNQGPPGFPRNWSFDPDAFQSGLDYSSDELSGDEWSSLQDWYVRFEGEVPRHIASLARLRPDLLKAYRQRFETCLVALPKQVMPWVHIHVNVQRGFVPGIREGILLARGFGMTRTQTLEAISWGLFYGGPEAAALVDDAAGEILDAWEGR